MVSAPYDLRKSALRVPTILVLIGCMTASQGCREKPRAPSGTWCQNDSDCQTNLNCYVPSQDHGFCIPKAYASSDDDDDQCLYRATCTAARKLQEVCPECVLTPPLICTSVWEGIGSPWYKMVQARQQRLESTCLRPRPEQTWPPTSDPEELRRRYALSRSGALTPLLVNGWGVRFPLAWFADRPHYEEKARKLEKALDVPEFYPPCPMGMGLTFTAGQCGRFRNPDLSKPPPKITIRRGIPYYRRGEPHIM